MVCVLGGFTGGRKARCSHGNGSRVCGEATTCSLLQRCRCARGLNMKMRRNNEDLNLTFPLLWTNCFSNRLAWRAQGMLAGLGAVITLWVGRKGRGKIFMISWRFGERRGLSKWSATELGVGLRLDLEEETRKEEVKLVTYAICFPG